MGNGSYRHTVSSINGICLLQQMYADVRTGLLIFLVNNKLWETNSKPNVPSIPYLAVWLTSGYKGLSGRLSSVFNLQLVLASRSIISKRWKLPLLQAAFEWQISFTEQLLLSCFIYQTLHILAFSSHLNPPGMGTAPIVLVPCLFHHSYWSTEFFSVHFPFAFSDLWLKSWKKFTFVKLLIHPLTRLQNSHQLCWPAHDQASQYSNMSGERALEAPFLTEELFIVDGSWRRKESLFWEEGAVAASRCSMLQWITLPSHTHRHY